MQSVVSISDEREYILNQVGIEKMQCHATSQFENITMDVIVHYENTNSM